MTHQRRGPPRRLGSLLLLTWASQAVADAPYSLQVTINGNTTSASYERVNDVLNALESSALARFNPGYTGIEATSLAVGFRGLPLLLTYPTQGSSRLVLSIPSLGIVETFDGVNRNDSQTQLREHLKTNGNGILDRLMKEQARVSPVDPIAGNPNSLMSQMVGNGFAGAVAPVAARKDDTGGSRSQTGIGAQFGSFSQGGLRSNTVVLPLSYTMRADLDPRRQVGIALPVSYTQTGSARAYSVAPGLSYRHPMSDDWSLSPSVNLGVTGSADLAAVGAMLSASLSSRYVFSVAPFDLTIGNMASYFSSLKLRHGRYSADPGLRNAVLKNGVAVAMPVNWLEGGSSVELSYANTHFWGTALYTSNYHELGLTLGTNRSARSARTFFRAGISLLHAGRSKGAALNLGYWF